MSEMPLLFSVASVSRGNICLKHFLGNKETQGGNLLNLTSTVNITFPWETFTFALCEKENHFLGKLRNKMRNVITVSQGNALHLTKKC